jgi:hypothetical protein
VDRFSRVWILAAWLLAGCGGEGDGTLRSPETLAAEEKAGDFLEYYERVISLARQHAAHPDSFQAALDSLPGSHLTPEEWEAWTEPYREEPRQLGEHLEEVIANLGR